MSSHCAVRRIVMRDIAGGASEDRARNADAVREGFAGLRGRISGLRRFEVGVDARRVPSACDAVLFTEFDSQEALRAYGRHPEHLRVRKALGGIRTARHQVDDPTE